MLLPTHVAPIEDGACIKLISHALAELTVAEDMPASS
jgi:hypothetical protein